MPSLLRLTVPILAIVLSAPTLRAGGEPPPAAPAARDVLERFSFDRDCPLLLLPIELKGKKYRFALDTGASRSVYDSSLVPILGSSIETNEVGTPGGTTVVPLYHAPDAKLGRLTLPKDSPVAVADLHRLREVSGEEVYGLIGMDFLSHVVLRIDPDRGEIVFLRTTGSDPGRRLPVTLDNDEDGGIPFVEVHFDGMDAPERFSVDTGFGGFSSGDLRPETFDALVRQGKVKADRDCLCETLAGSSVEREGHLSEFALGGYRHAGLRFDRGVWNILGLNYVMRYVVTFDFPGRAMYLKKGAQFDAPDWLDMGGMRIDRIAGRVHVHSVERGGPAASAGIRPDDLILMAGGEKAESIRLQRLRRLLCTEGAKVSLVVRRGKDERTVQLELRDWRKNIAPDGKEGK